MTASQPEDHGPAFQHALRGDLAKQMDLAVLPMAAFPSPAQQLLDQGSSSDVHEVSIQLSVPVRRQSLHLLAWLCMMVGRASFSPAARVQ